jgi:Mg2+/Co2+ transporter CorB
MPADFLQHSRPRKREDPSRLNEASIGVLCGILAALILFSGFFSGSETSMMSLNRYRLKHLRKSHRSARLATRLLERPDRLIGLILIGNNLVNILASSIATVIALRLWGDAGIAVAAILLTIVILIFAEVTPKTLAALHPERIAIPQFTETPFLYTTAQFREDFIDDLVIVGNPPL